MPSWAEYIDKYGGLWTKERLCEYWLRIMRCNIGERGVTNMVKNHFVNATTAFKEYLHNRINSGTLVILVERNHDE